jgi:hypothetical protein
VRKKCSWLYNFIIVCVFFHKAVCKKNCYFRC